MVTVIQWRTESKQFTVMLELYNIIANKSWFSSELHLSLGYSTAVVYDN